MTTANNGAQKAFRRALLFSFVLHLSLVVIMAASGSFNRPEKKGMIHYVNFLGGPGGGGGGQGTGGAPGGGGVTAVQAPKAAAPAKPAKKESLRDLTVPSKVKAEPQSSLHYPTDKPKKASAKKAAITKPEPHIPGAEAGETNGQAAPGAVSGNGLRPEVRDGRRRDRDRERCRRLRLRSSERRRRRPVRGRGLPLHLLPADGLRQDIGQLVHVDERPQPRRTAADPRYISAFSAPAR